MSSRNDFDNRTENPACASPTRRFGAKPDKKDCGSSSGAPEFMEDAFHCNFDSVAVRIDRFWVMRPAGWVERLSGGQEGFDSFVSKDEQRSHRSEPGGERLVAAGVADPADDLFAAEFLQIIPGMAGAVLAWVLFTECAHANGDIGGGEAVGRGGSGTTDSDVSDLGQ